MSISDWQRRAGLVLNLYHGKTENAPPRLFCANLLYSGSLSWSGPRSSGNGSAVVDALPIAQDNPGQVNYYYHELPASPLCIAQGVTP